MQALQRALTLLSAVKWLKFLERIWQKWPYSVIFSLVCCTAQTIIWLVVVVSVCAKMTVTDDNFNDDAFTSFSFYCGPEYAGCGMIKVLAFHCLLQPGQHSCCVFWKLIWWWSHNNTENRHRRHNWHLPIMIFPEQGCYQHSCGESAVTWVLMSRERNRARLGLKELINT